jgi:transposase
MIHLPSSVRVYFCLTPCDMRRSFDGLHGLVRDHVDLDPFAGHLYLFASRRRDRLKILYWGVSRKQGNLRSCTKDGRRPPGVGFQELTSNRPEPLRSKGVVVNVRGKGVRTGVR